MTAFKTTIRSRDDFEQALDRAATASLAKTREELAGHGLDEHEIAAIIATQTERLAEWRNQVIAAAIHQTSAPPMPAGMTISERPARSPVGHRLQ